jgi:cytoskeletal protein RodZ
MTGQMPEIGATLREARMRARIDVSEIEATTKIRAKYLRALENEEWGLLPGPTFVKSFLRTYAQALDLDGKALVEEYRLQNERPSEGVLEPIVAPAARRGRSRTPPKGPSRGYLAAVVATAGLILLLVVLLIADGGGSKKKTPPAASAKANGATTKRHQKRHKSAAASNLVSLSLHTTAANYVCLIGDGGRRLIGGEELQAEHTTRTYHARHFLLTLGNSSVTLTIDGKPREVEPSSEAIGYSITKAFGRHTLPASERPTCR